MRAARRRDRWLLVRVAAQNIGQSRLRAIFLGLAVMLGVGVGFSSFVSGWALHAGIAVSFARMGADLVVVPRAALVNITSSLLTVQPTDETLDAALANTLGAIPGVARVAPQRLVPALVDGRPAQLIAFDPAQDFSVLTWLDRHQSGGATPDTQLGDGVIAGGRAAGRIGDQLNVCGKPIGLYGRLGNTGVGPFDDSYFVSFETLAAIAAFCRSSDPIGETRHGTAACPADLPPGRVSALLLQLSPAASAQDVKFAIAQLPNVRVVEGNSVLTSSRQALSSLLIGVAAFTAVQMIALLIVVSLLFSAILRERYREIGLLRAMGARPGQIMTIILAEAAIITGLGGLAGLVCGAALLVIFARSLGFYFGLLGIPFSWPPAAVLETGAVAALAFSALLGLLGAFLPAWRVRRMAPDALIRAEAR